MQIVEGIKRYKEEIKSVVPILDNIFPEKGLTTLIMSYIKLPTVSLQKRIRVIATYNCFNKRDNWSPNRYNCEIFKSHNNIFLCEQCYTSKRHINTRRCCDNKRHKIFLDKRNGDLTIY
jgi:recombinational DNA repair protein RecR